MIESIRAALKRKGRAADHDADQDAGDETPLHDDDDDRQQRQIFDHRKPPPRLDDPFVQLVGAEIDQQAAEHEFRHVAEQRRAQQPASAREIAATVRPDSRPVPPLLKLSTERLTEMQPV